MKREKKRLIKIYMVGNNHPIRLRVIESTLNDYVIAFSKNLQEQKNDLSVAHGWFMNNAMISHIRVYKR